MHSTSEMAWAAEPPKAVNIIWAEVPKMCFTTRAWRPLSRSLRNGVCQLSSRRAFALFSPISFLAIASIVLLKPAFWALLSSSHCLMGEHDLLWQTDQRPPCFVWHQPPAPQTSCILQHAYTHHAAYIAGTFEALPTTLQWRKQRPRTKNIIRRPGAPGMAKVCQTAPNLSVYIKGWIPPAHEIARIRGHAWKHQFFPIFGASSCISSCP